MPGIVVPTRRHHSSTGDESADEDASDHLASEDSSPSQNSQNKRQRLIGDGERRNTRDSWHLDTPQTASRGRQLPNPSISRPQRDSATSTSNENPTSALEHQPGSIVRISLTDFVTYSSVSFHPGPGLNMVIGPNGTGKSTLVCAICLGLGWSTSHLGRAKEVHEFVKHDCSEASIEIELKGKPGERNPIVRRLISKDGGSKWWINGQTTNQKNVTNLARGYNIQIDNLCQFLPQDRVTEFAGLTPVERLTQTVKATAPVEMIEQHEQLKLLRGEQRGVEKGLADAKVNVTNLESRQNMQQADVERFRERERLVQELNFLQTILQPMAEYNAAKVRATLAKERQDDAKKDLHNLQSELGPSLEAEKKKTTYVTSVKHVVDQRARLYRSIEQRVQDCERNRNDLSDKIKECVTKRQAERTSHKEEKMRMTELQRKINLIKTAMENRPPNFDPAEYNERKREKTRQMRDLQSRIQELGNETGALKLESDQKKERKQQAEKEAADLRSQVGQQLSILKSKYPDTYRAWEWISKNQDKFESRVYGPPIVECSISDKRFAARVEALFQKTEFCVITCTNDNDLQTLSKQLFDTMKLPDIFLRNNKRPLSSYRPPVDENEKRRLGISGWALDYISGPDAVLSTLCGERSRLHSTAIMEQNGGDEEYKRLQESVIENWITPTTAYRIVRRREYNASSAAATQIRPAQVWTEQQVDSQHEGDLRDNISGWESELIELDEKIQSKKQQIDQLRKEERQLKAEEEAIEREKTELQKKTSEFNALPNKLRDNEERLRDKQKSAKELRDRLDEITAEEYLVTVRKGQAAIDYARAVEGLRTVHIRLVEATVAYIEATSDVETLSARNRSVNDMLSTRKAEVKEMEKEFLAKRNEARRLTNEFSKLLEDNEAMRAKLAELSSEDQSRTPEDINLAIEGINSRLAVIHGGSANVIREFEERAKRIDALKNAIADQARNLDAVSIRINEIRATWEPQLDQIVGKISDAFSASFEKIHCVGEVIIYKAGEEGRDFESWALNIKVKFREQEELSVLDSHRQSGGERSVTTVFFLMALQNLSRAPFRVVDEINQGMDPRNERMVHEQMVDVACGSYSSTGEEDDGGQGSQYFLITPKLLMNLKYRPGMKVHCIASGQFMPDSPSTLDFKALVARAKSQLASHPQLATTSHVSDVSTLSGDVTV